MDQGPDGSLSTNWTLCCTWPVLPPTLFSFFGFDSRGNQMLAIDAKGNTTVSTFDGASRQTQTLQHLRSGQTTLRVGRLDLGDLLIGIVPRWQAQAPSHSFELALPGTCQMRCVAFV